MRDSFALRTTDLLGFHLRSRPRTQQKQRGGRMTDKAHLASDEVSNGVARRCHVGGALAVKVYEDVDGTVSGRQGGSAIAKEEPVSQDSLRIELVRQLAVLVLVLHE